MSYLIGITENDYREYRKNFSKVEYSFARRGEAFPVPMKQIREVTNITILKKWEFLEVMKDPKHAFYFYKNDEGETIGIVFLKFTGKTCTIAEFSVFEHLKGWEQNYIKQSQISAVSVVFTSWNYGVHLTVPKSSGKKWASMKKAILSSIVGFQKFN